MLSAADLLACLALPPERIVEMLRRRDYKIAWAWQDTWQDAHSRVKTVAKVVRLDILQDLYSTLEQAILQGHTARWYRKQLEPVLQAKGWWGKIEEINPETGETETVQAGSPWRLNTVFRTNTGTLYSAGRWESQVQDSARPYWLYVAVRDLRTRPAHADLNGQCLPSNHPFWQSFYPPNGWNCRCSVIALTAEEVRARGIVVGGIQGVLGESLRSAGGEVKPVATWTAGGKTTSPDAGFSWNPGAAWRPDLAKYQGSLATLARSELS